MTIPHFGSFVMRARRLLSYSLQCNKRWVRAWGLSPHMHSYLERGMLNRSKYDRKYSCPVRKCIIGVVVSLCALYFFLKLARNSFGRESDGEPEYSVSVSVSKKRCCHSLMVFSRTFLFRCAIEKVVGSGGGREIASPARLSASSFPGTPARPGTHSTIM